MIEVIRKYSLFLVIVLLFFYSFTQIDLSLTFSQASIWQSIQKNFQYIGYFNRPLSTILFISIIILMFAYYVWFLRKAIRKDLKIKELVILIVSTAVVLSFSYNAFSYDLFNYIFDAKIVTFYHENPYFHRAMDYPEDPMLSFMRWTHRVYPYGPVWLGLTIPVSFIGMNIFLLTFFLFKFLITGFYLASVFLIYKINKKINPDHAIFNTTFFALNPLIIIESLVSSHHDIVMAFFALSGIYLYFLRKRILAIILIIISSQVKIPTIGLLMPLIVSFIPFKEKLDNNKFIILSIISMLLASGYALSKIEIQPWYFIWVIPFVALLKPNKYVLSLSIGLSLGLLLRYTVLLYFGNWDGIGVPIRNALTIITPLVFIAFVYVYDKLPKSLGAQE